jgi:hypothetical protein
MATNGYTKLVSLKGKFCKGNANKSDVKKAAANYIKEAVKKGKTKTEAEKIAGRVLRKGCSITSSIAGRKKKSSTRKKSAAVGKRKKAAK